MNQQLPEPNACLLTVRGQRIGLFPDPEITDIVTQLLISLAPDEEPDYEITAVYVVWPETSHE